ncbi:MAG: type II secretion system protein [Burkholderiales bacterium]
MGYVPILQSGFTLLGMLIVTAVMGAGLAAFGQLASHAAQREKEAELLYRGNQYRQAIASYYKTGQAYPRALADLLQDKRFPMPVRHLRKLYPDPITGSPGWGLVEAPGGGIMGVYSPSEQAPIKSGGFALANQHFADAPRYADWQFVHRP